MRICVLGDIRAGTSGRPARVNNERQQRILAALVLAGPTGLGIEQLVTRVWDEADEPPDPVRALRTYVSRLRNAIGDDAGELVVTRPGGYMLVAEPDDLDAAVFERTAERASRELDPYVALELYDEALGLWSGHAYRDLAHLDWVRPEAVRLDELRLSAEEARLRIRLDADRHADVAADAERLILENPYREQLTAIRATALYRSGRQVEALAILEQHRSRMRDDLGVDPSPELRDLEVKILNHDPDLAGGGAGGRRLRGYRLGNRIGEGAHSIVYRATQPSIGREVAIKVIRKELANERDFIQRFEAEAQIVARLQHPRIVPLYDFWREADHAYLVMPWLEGGSLAHRLRAGPLSLDETIRVVRHVADGLDFAHSRGVTHRDVKPSNVLLDSDGNAYISDFGIAHTESSVAGEARLSAGTQAPGQAGMSADGSGVDTYALAAMTYHLLSGSPPWPRMAATGTLPNRQRPALPSLQLSDRSIERAVNSVLSTVTATDITARPGTATPFADALAEAMSSKPTRPSMTPAANPYRGLAAFEEPDAPFFFGREELVETVVTKLRDEPLALLVGPSGSGKSSLLRAGVIPVLRSEGRLPVLVTPSADPLGSLAAALESVSTATSGSIRADLDAGAPLGAIVGRIAPGTALVIAVDQMEELFTLAEPDEAEELMAALATAVTTPHDDVRVLGSIRADFFGHPLTSPSFGPLAGSATVTIGPMRVEQLAAAISEPARLSGVDVEEALVAELASETAGRAGSLPLMQFALTRAWDERTGSVVTLADHQRLGGLTGTLVRSAEEIWDQLGSSDQDAARRLLSRLVHIGEEVTRRREDFAAALSLAGVEPGLIERFARARLLTLDRDQETREPTIELSHEALIDAWPRLARWVEDSGTALLTAQRLRADASDWDEAGRSQDLLYRGGRLAAAQKAITDPAVAVAPREREFLEASAAAKEQADEAANHALIEQERQRVRRRALTVLAAVAGVIGVGALVFGVLASRRASDESSAADFARLISRATDLQTTDTEMALLLSAEAYRQNPGFESQRALLGALQKVEGTVEVWEAPRFPFTSFYAFDAAFGGCYSVVGPGQFVAQPNGFAGGTPDPGGVIVDIDVNDHTVHRVDGSRLECQVSRSPADNEADRLYAGSDSSQTTIVVASDGAEIGAYEGFVRPFFDAEGRLLARSGDPDTVGEYVELDPLTGEVLSDPLFEAIWATVTDGGRFISVISRRTAGTVPDPSALLDADTYQVVVDLSSETGRATAGRSSADDSRFGYVSKDDRLLVWDTDSGEVAIDTRVGENAEAIAFSPDGSSIVLLVDDGLLQIRSGSDGQIVDTIDVGREAVMAIDWAQEDRIAVLRSSGVVDLVAIRGGGLYETGPACCERNEFSFFVTDGIPNPYAVYGNFDTGVNTYIDVVTGEEFHVDVSPWVFEEFGADMRMTRDMTTVLIRPPFEIFRVDLDGTAEDPLYPFGNEFVLRQETPDHMHRDLHGGNEFVFLKLTEGSVSPNSRNVVIEELMVGVIDIDTMEVVVEPNRIDLRSESPKASGANLLPGGVLVVDQYLDDGRIHQQYFTADGERILEIFINDSLGWERLTPDRRYLLTADPSNDAVHRWDVETGVSIVLPVRGTPQRPDMLSDGRFMIQTRSGQYELWDVEAGAAIGVLADAGPLADTRPAVHPDESHVWIVLDGRWTKIPLDPERWFELACEYAGRALTEAEWRELVSSDRPYRNVCDPTT